MVARKRAAQPNRQVVFRNCLVHLRSVPSLVPNTQQMTPSFGISSKKRLTKSETQLFRVLRSAPSLPIRDSADPFLKKANGYSMQDFRTSPSILETAGTRRCLRLTPTHVGQNAKRYVTEDSDTIISFVDCGNTLH